MILIIEGPDLSGKSTAIEKLGKKFNSGFTLKNNYKPKSENSEIYTQYWAILGIVNSYLKKRDSVVILDRFFPSQAVYSYFRGKDEMHSDEIIELERFCKDKVLYVYLDTDLKILQQRFLERGDEHITINDLKKIKERYDSYFNYTIMSKIRINSLEPNWIEKIIEAMS